MPARGQGPTLRAVERWPDMRPARSAVSEQRSRALAQANDVRVARAGLKRALASGQRSAAGVISDPSSSVLSMSVRQVVLSQRGWGPARCRRLLRFACVPENKDLGSLTERQRRALLTMLEVDDDDGVTVHEFNS